MVSFKITSCPSTSSLSKNFPVNDKIDSKAFNKIGLKFQKILKIL